MGNLKVEAYIKRLMSDEYPHIEALIAMREARGFKVDRADIFNRALESELYDGKEKRCRDGKEEAA